MLGEFENCEYNSIPLRSWSARRAFGVSEEAARRKRCAAEKTTAFLPLDKAKIKTIGVIGPNANDRMASATTARRQDISRCWRASGLWATMCACCTPRVATSTKTAWRGLGLPGDRLSEAETVAEHSDVVVLVTGLNENLEGEMDRAILSAPATGEFAMLPAPQKLMEIVAKTGKPVILINTGSAMVTLRQENFSPP